MKKWVLFIVIFTCFFPYPTKAETVIHIPKGHSIQEAIDNSPSGSVIKVEKGTYKESLTITKPIQLKAEGKVVIDGNHQGHVIHIKANDVKLEGFTIIHSNKNAKDAGIFLDQVEKTSIKNNHLQQVYYGIYVNGGHDHHIKNNTITSLHEHFSKRGNGIHLLGTTGNVIENNKMTMVQDGVYFDEANENQITQNQVTGSRYALHFMFSKDNSVTKNRLNENINGLMIMNSEKLIIQHNQLSKNLNYRGYGALIFDSDDVVMRNNNVTYNHTGISLQDARNVKVLQNTIAGNFIGLEVRGESKDNLISNNQFVGNIMQNKISTEGVYLDNGQIGNYWDDQHSYDLDGNGIGDLPYQTNSGYERLLEKYPHYQFYFESPAMNLWHSVEKMFPTIAKSTGLDRYPLTDSSGKGNFGMGTIIVLSVFSVILLFLQWKRRVHS
ncbi:nitrous oxidase accessory protein [Oikeobacillus pervagus]|uniref:Nitrous oxidase accessory protein n=1 Tax=Oikeobacillus pervagus TaxID=1325931 RepID=A0AAJ1T5C5_9BACI|nr:nitrous oxide reductase family maturation protein NosD [Oikeobacillus pervagus]MDQ0215526.1 nitrous oxidase accessory protein [Oikeobacillus pervagus]